MNRASIWASLLTLSTACGEAPPAMDGGVAGACITAREGDTYVCREDIAEEDCASDAVHYPGDPCSMHGYGWYCSSPTGETRRGTNPRCQAVPPATMEAPTPPNIPWLDADESPAAAPAPPAPPAAGTCPDGWTVRGGSDEGFESCEPWPSTGLESCTGVGYHLPGTAGCADLGTACPSDGRFAVDGVAAVYVRVGATGGDGSLAAPYGTIADALGAASATVRVRLEAGEHVVAAPGVSIPDGVLIEGVCAAGSIIRGQLDVGAAASLQNLTLAPDATAQALIVSGASAAATLQDVRVTGGEQPVQVLDAATLTASRLLIDGTTVAGLAYSGESHISLEDFAIVDVEGTGIDADAGYNTLTRGVVARVGEPPRSAVGVGLELSDGSATLTAVVFESNVGRAITAIGARVNADHLVIRDTRTSTDGSRGEGMVLDDFGRADLVHTLFERNHGAALSFDGYSNVDLVDSVILETLVGETSDGIGVLGRSLGDLTLMRVLIAESIVAGISLDMVLLDASDLSVRDTVGDALRSLPGVGIDVQSGRALLTRALLSDGGEGIRVDFGALTDVRVERSSTGPGITAYGAGVSTSRVYIEDSHHAGIAYLLPNNDGITPIVVEDVTIRGVEGAGFMSHLGDLVRGGIVVLFHGLASGSTVPPPLTVRSVSIEGTQGAGLSASGFYTSSCVVELEDLRVQDTEGYGVALFCGASSAMLSRVAVLRSAEVGIHIDASEDDVLTNDIVVRDTASDGAIAFGLVVEASFIQTFWTGERIEVTGTRGVGVYATGSLEGTIRDVLVDGTCEDCRDPNIGVGAYEEAQLELNAFLVTGHNFCGVQAAVDGMLEVEGGEVVLNDNGACIDDEEYPVGMLSREVLYRDNRVNIGGQALVPPPPPGVSTD